MRFEFTESADFAAALGLTYDPVNKSYDRREELEQENDKTRLKNAEMPVKLIKELIDFSPKAKQMYEGIQVLETQRLELQLSGLRRVGPQK